MSTRKRKATPRYDGEDDDSPVKRAKSTSKRPAKRRPVPRKRKPNPRYDEEDDEYPVQRAESTSEAPNKRTPALRKRKTNPRYDDEEDEAPVECAKSPSETPSKRTPAPRKRKANPRHDEEDDEHPVQRAKSKSETPNKRTPALRKRKANPRYNDDEDESPVEYVEATRQTPTKRRPAPRAAKAKRGDPDWLVTNEKSPLAYEDLHATLSDPKTYEDFTREDWEDLRSTLPENVPLNPDGYSISWEFLKYDADFRRGIREFQEDLSTGRLEPEWQAAAAEAMEERARGDYDDYKEKIYEEFWGQKQKLAHDALAGDSTSLKLETMIENGTFRVGDEFVFTRTIGRKEKRVLIEKELKIIAVGNNTLTFAIPPGQLKFPRPMIMPQPVADAKPVESEPPAGELQPVDAVMDNEMNQDEEPVENKSYRGGSTSGAQEQEESAEGDPLVKVVQPVDEVMDIESGGNDAPVEEKTYGNGRNTNTQEQGAPNEGGPIADEAQPVNAVMDNRTEGDGTLVENKTDGSQPKTGTPERNAVLGSVESGRKTAPSDGHRNDKTPPADTTVTGNGPLMPDSEPPEAPEAVIHHEINNLGQLMSTVIEIDGRLDPKDIKAVPAASSWKYMRVKRNNQDLGTLFEMRDEFYAYKLPKLAKSSKR